MAQLLFRRLHPDALPPHRAHPGDLGYDLFAVEGVTLPPGQMRPVATGIALQFPDGFGGIIKDRSSMAAKRVTTSAGVIDHGYRGEVKVLLSNHGNDPFAIEPGMKICQLVPVKVEEWEVAEGEDLSASSRGTGGFGSTGS